MRITEEIAKEVIDKIYPIVRKEISIANDRGVVVGSTDPRWLGQTYKEALEVIEKREIIEVNPEEGEGDCGINFPIFFGKEVIGVLWVTGKGEHVRDIGRIACVTVELLLEQKFSQTLENLRKQALDSFISSLLRDSYGGWEDIASYMGILEYDLSLPRFAVAIGIPEYSVVIRSALRMMEESLSRKPLRYDVKEKFLNICRSTPGVIEKDIIAHIGGGLFIILKVENRCKTNTFVRRDDLPWLESFLSRLQSEMKVDAFAGVGSCADSIPGLRSSCREALSALEVGILLSRVRSRERIFLYNSPMVMLGNLLKSADPEIKKRFVHLLIGNISDDKELVQTLKEYIISEMNANEASKKLFIHKNTLFYRLKKVKRLTGLDPQSPLSAFYLWLALCAEPFVHGCSVE